MEYCNLPRFLPRFVIENKTVNHFTEQMQFMERAFIRDFPFSLLPLNVSESDAPGCGSRVRDCKHGTNRKDFYPGYNCTQMFFSEKALELTGSYNLFNLKKPIL